MLALRDIVARRGHVRHYWEERGVKLVVGHLYPDYLNIYADRGEHRRADAARRWRGHELEVRPTRAGDAVRPGEHDLFYVGGGQDREQELIAPDARRAGARAARGGRAAAPLRSRSAAATSSSAASTATASGDELPGAGCCRCTPSPASAG